MVGLADTTLRYAADGSSKATNGLGMRAMQERVWDVRDSQYILLKSPPASGKSRAAMYLGLDKVHNQGLRKALIAVPERSIGGSFRGTALTSGGFFADWVLDRDLCSVGSETGSKVAELVEFLRSDEERIALCTHATLRFAFARAGVEPFDGCLVCLDELHHASSNEESRLGAFLHELMERGSAHVLAMTGSYFRGDAEAIMHPNDEARFQRVIYTYYEQLNGYEYLKTLHIGFRFYQGRYLDHIDQAIDPIEKTIVHIPHVGSNESVSDKMFEVDAIISGLGTPLGVDPATGFEKVRSGRRIIKVANLVDDGVGREKVMASLRAVTSRDDVDVIIALGMAKEGFDWIWCEHVLTVGYRGSLTEIVQIIGRATRDAPGKTEARFTNLVSAPYANDDVVARAVNDMLKAISVSLLMEQVMAPTFKFRTRRGADDMSGRPVPDGRPEPVTNAGEITVVGGPAVSETAKDIIEADFPDLFANVQSDPRTLTVMVNPDAHHADIMHDVITTDIVRRRYPDQPDDVIRDIVTLFGVRSDLTRVVNDDPSVVQTTEAPVPETSTPETSSPEKHDTERPPRGDEGDERESSGGDSFVRGTRRFVDVRDLKVDLLGARREFVDAYELLSKALTEDVLTRLHGEVRAMKVPMTQDEAERLMPRIRQFIETERREPNLNSPNGREVRLADGLAFMRKLARERRSQLAGADGAQTSGANAGA